MEQHFVEEPCQEGWHRPVLSLFAKVFTVFSCKLPKVTGSRKFAFHRRMQVVFFKQTSPKKPSQGSFGEAVKKEENEG